MLTTALGKIYIFPYCSYQYWTILFPHLKFSMRATVSLWDNLSSFYAERMLGTSLHVLCNKEICVTGTQAELYKLMDAKIIKPA